MKTQKQNKKTTTTTTAHHYSKYWWNIIIRCISFLHRSQSSGMSLETRIEIIPFRGFHLNGQILDAISVVLYTFRDQYTLLIKIFHL